MRTNGAVLAITCKITCETTMTVDAAAVFVHRILATTIFFALLAPAAIAATDSAATRELHSDWRFAKGDHPGAEAEKFDDTSWSTVRVPHDWAIAGPFDPNENGFAAKLPWRGVGWYRRSFTLDCQKDEQVYLDFDGVMAFPRVYVNGHLAGHWDYDYASFRVDATPFVNRKGRNVVAVRVDTTKHGTRWYPGAGIYRKVTLQIRRPIHIAQWGISVTTPEVNEKDALLEVQASVENHSEAEAPIGVVCQIRDPDGKRVARFSDRLPLPAAGSKTVKLSTQLPDPQRWDVDAPRLYRLET